MLSSMTGYGRAEFTEKNITAVAELRSVNNRFLEVSARLPRSLSVRENEVKELIRRKILRGKINATVTVEHSNGGSVPLRINVEAAKEVYKLLNRLRRSTGMKEKIKIDHLLHFSEVIEQEQVPEADEQEWTAAREAIEKAVDGLRAMREQEGRELEKDLRHRVHMLDQQIGRIEELSTAQVPAERERLRERIRLLVENEALDEGRLELERALNITEEVMRQLITRVERPLSARRSASAPACRQFWCRRGLVVATSARRCLTTRRSSASSSRSRRSATSSARGRGKTARRRDRSSSAWGCAPP